MEAHPHSAAVQLRGCRALGSVCCGSDAAVKARLQRAILAGARAAATSARQAHVGNTRLQSAGRALLTQLGFPPVVGSPRFNGQ